MLPDPALANASDSRPAPLAGALRLRPTAVVGGILLGVMVATAVLAPLIAPYRTDQPSGTPFAPPSGAHWLGLDDAGVDMVSLLISGGRISLLVGVAATAVSLLIGGIVGVTAGYVGGLTDTALMRLTDLVLVIPALPMMIAVAAVWGSSLRHVVIVIGALQWTWGARMIRAQVAGLRRRMFIQRVRSIGAGDVRIVARHILPSLLPLMFALAVLAVGYAIFAESALAFLGLSDPTATSWGTIISHAFQRTAVSAGAWWAVVPPGVCIAVVVVSCHLLAHAAEQLLDRRLTTPHLAPRYFRMDEQTETGDPSR